MQLGGISVGRNTDLHRPVAVRACHVVLDKGPVKIELFRQSELPDAANGYDKYIYTVSFVYVTIYIYTVYIHISPVWVAFVKSQAGCKMRRHMMHHPGRIEAQL